jgi:hypothetical protein
MLSMSSSDSEEVDKVPHCQNPKVSLLDSRIYGTTINSFELENEKVTVGEDTAD